MAVTEPAFDPYHMWLQVPTGSRPPTHYQLLGLAYGEANPEVVRQAMLMRSAYVRHFQTGPNAADATRILEELAEASRVLVDAELRKAYEARVKPPPTPTPADAPKPALASKPVVIAPPKTPSDEYALSDDADRRRKPKKSRRRKRTSLVGMLFGVFFVGAGMGMIGYLYTVYNRDPIVANSTKVEATKKSSEKSQVGNGVGDSKDDSKDDAKSEDASTSNAASNPTPIRERPADAVTVRLSVSPADASLNLEPIGDALLGGPKAWLEGSGGERTIVAEKGALPLVVAGSASGFQPTRVTVFSSDAGRLVVVQLDRGGGGSFSGNSGNATPGKSFQGNSTPSKGWRPVGGWRPGVPVSNIVDKPVWKYTTTRPAFDWAANVFGDVLWNEGEGAFGTKVGRNQLKVPGLWLRTNWVSRDLWMRKNVTLPAEIKNAQVRWSYRSANVIHLYVNGAHKLTWQSTNYRILSDVTQTAGFQPGDNVIGVHAQNGGGGGLADVGFEWMAMEEAP